MLVQATTTVGASSIERFFKNLSRMHFSSSTRQLSSTYVELQKSSRSLRTNTQGGSTTDSLSLCSWPDQRPTRGSIFLPG